MNAKRNSFFRIPYRIAFILAVFALFSAIFTTYMTINLSSQPYINFNNVKYEKSDPEYNKALRACQLIWITLSVSDVIGCLLFGFIGLRVYRNMTIRELE